MLTAFDSYLVLVVLAEHKGDTLLHMYLRDSNYTQVIEEKNGIKDFALDLNDDGGESGITSLDSVLFYTQTNNT